MARSMIAIDPSLAEEQADGSHRRHERIVSNLGFVVKTARQYRNLGLSFDDLISEGNVGLIQAADRFDDTKGVKFITYAIWWIRKAMLMALSRQVNVVTVPEYHSRMARHMRLAEGALQHKLGRKPLRQEVVEQLGQGTGAKSTSQDYSHREVSLSAPVSKEGTRTLADLLTAPATPSIEDLIQHEAEVLVNEALHQLDERERRVILWRFGLAGGTGLTLLETGKQLGVSRERVRQIEELAMRRLRRILTRRSPRPDAADQPRVRASRSICSR